MAGRDVVFRVKRYRPESGGKPAYQEYRIPYRDDMVVLDGLNYIKDYIDATLTYRWSCRMGICGSCGANVNGTPRLTCGTYIRDVHKGTVTVDPLANFPILKDLVVDFDDRVRHAVHRPRGVGRPVQGVSPVPGGCRSVSAAKPVHQLHAVLRGLPCLRREPRVRRTGRVGPGPAIHPRHAGRGRG